METTGSAPKAIRPVGYMGKYNTSRHHLGLCRRVIFTCRYVAEPSDLEAGSVRSVLENALSQVIVGQPFLQVGVVGEGSVDPAYVLLETIDMREAIDWRVMPSRNGESYITDHLLRSLEAEHSKLWNDLARRPGWKLTVYQSAKREPTEHVHLDIAFAFHHAFGDGQSALLFHRDLLRALNRKIPVSSAADLRDHILHLKAPTALPPPMEAIVPFSISWIFFLKTIWSSLLWPKLAPSWLKKDPATELVPWTGGQVTLEPYETNIRLLEVPSDVVGSLLVSCRKNNTTLTPLLHALALASLSSRLPSDLAPAFQASTPISLRRFTRGDFDANNTMHCLVTSHSHLFDRRLVARLRSSLAEDSEGISRAAAKALIWEAAVELGTNLKTKVSSLPADDVIALLPWVSDMEDFWMNQVGKKRNVSWECSNPGSLRVSDENYDREEQVWKIERCIFTQGALPMGSALSLNVAGVEGQGLCITVSWQETIVEASLADGLIQDLSLWLIALGKNDV